MKPERLPFAARPLARHDAILIRPGSRRGAAAGDHNSDDRTSGGQNSDDQGNPHGAVLALAGQRIAHELAPRIARLLGGEVPAVVGVMPRTVTGAELASIAGPLAGNSLFAMHDGVTRFIASIEATALLRMLDRAFGGRGELPDALPTALPLSSLLLIERVEGVIAGALAAALDLADEAAPAALRRNGEFAQVTPFAVDDALRLFAFDIAEPGMKRWRITLAFAETSLGALFGINAGPSAVRSTAATDPCAAPFGDMPLPLVATLVDMAIPLARLARLQVGDVLPVAVARSVPLHLGAARHAGNRAIAHGAIGAFDDRVAVQLTEAFR